MGDYKVAKERLEQALEMKWAMYGQDARNTNLAVTMGNLGGLLYEMGDYKAPRNDSNKLWRWNGAYAQDAKNTDLAGGINSLGAVLKEMGDYKGAKERYIQDLKMQWAVYGEDAKNTDLAGTINNLGVLLKNRGDYKGAKGQSCDEETKVMAAPRSWWHWAKFVICRECRGMWSADAEPLDKR